MQFFPLFLDITAFSRWTLRVERQNKTKGGQLYELLYMAIRFYPPLGIPKTYFIHTFTRTRQC